MMKRKEMKKRARQTVKKHYGILLVVCLIAAFLGVEFTNSLDFVKQYNVSGETQEGLSTGATTGSHRASLASVVQEALSGDLDKAEEEADSITKEAVAETRSGKGNAVLGRSRGVLALLINSVMSGQIVVTIVQAARNMGLATSMILMIAILIALLLSFLVWIFLQNMYTAIVRRIFLESRTYEHVSFQRMLVFLRVKKWANVSMVMFMNSLLYMLWSLTIVGAVIKRYSYYMVPYIVAENPAIHWKEAITLSRKMMKGHKMECFVFELSFILWDILGGITAGITNLFYVNQYKTASFTEYYAQLRSLAKQNNLPGSQLMNDVYLFEKADEQTLRNAYKDISALVDAPEEETKLTGFRGFLANTFGITIYHRAEEEKYEAEEERRLIIKTDREILEGKAYPGRLSAIPEASKKARVEQVHYLRHYSIPTLILMFFIFSLIGWTWEVSLHLISDGEFVNRGVLQGPWLPIYGTGGILILTLLNKFRKKPVVEFIATVILCGCVEYFTAYYLEMTHGGQKWWDYSGYFLNLHGRICAEGLLIFGVGGLAIVYVAAPLLDNCLRRIRYCYAIPLCAVLLVIFGADEVYSKKHPNMGKGITDYTGACLEIQEETACADAEKLVPELFRDKYGRA